MRTYGGKMTELLAPAGNMEALIAAISNGCDAIYLGMQKFGARAYSSNFDLETLKEAVIYAHLRNVKIYVTMNTIVFEDEIPEMKAQMDALNEIGVDGIIVQDLAAFNYIVSHFQDMEAHCSTQMGIDDLEGTMLFKEMGAKRVVLSREVPIETVKAIKKEAQIPLEIFVHGALCVSYSGNCLMSGLIGYRSGNRGRCVGSCRKPYELIDTTSGESLGNHYILSTKDLNTIDHIEALKDIDSLKIEGRMKEPAYVANVVSKYRKALDHTITEEDKDDLSKTFNRTFTKGYLFHEDKKEITNILRPNNSGYEIGEISNRYKGMYEIRLSRPLNQNDIIRISHNDEDVNLTVVKLYNREENLINHADVVCYIKVKEELSKGDKVYISKDYAYYKTLEGSLDHEFRRFKLDIKVYAYAGAKLTVDAEGLGFHYLYESDDVIGEAINNPASKDQIVKAFSKLNDTIFELGHVAYEGYNAFIPAKLLNRARREIVQALYDLKITSQKKRRREVSVKEKINFSLKDDIQNKSRKPYLTASVVTQAQYDICQANGIDDIYFEDNTIRRNQNHYTNKTGQLLIGGYGGIYRYRDTNTFVADYSLNVVNAEACFELYRLGAKRVTLSYELNKQQIQELVTSYKLVQGANPPLEMIVYGKAPLMFTKYCPMKKLDQCDVCRTKTYELKDEHGTFPILSHKDCTSTILNGKTLNLLDEMPSINGVEAFRLNFTVESRDEVEAVIRMAKGKLGGKIEDSVFNQEEDTRGHYNKEIM